MTVKELKEIELITLLRKCYAELVDEWNEALSDPSSIHMGHVMAHFAVMYKKDWCKAHKIDCTKLDKNSKLFNDLAAQVTHFTETMEMYNGVTWAKFNDNIYLSDDDILAALI